MFIGRQEELAFLEKRYQMQGGQMITLYGRRRVGKTETLRKFCEGKDHVFFTCTECSDKQQLISFSNRMLRKGIPAASYIASFSDWGQAFESILELPGEGKKLLIIDEFPYMVKGNKSIPSILQNIWDEKLKDRNVMIILCGSAMAFIEKDILAEKNPLYGRMTGILKMGEMDFFDAARFVKNYSVEDQIKTYAILGGIPHYLKQFDDKVSLAENIKENILHRGSILYSEVEFLIHQELREPMVYNSIIEAVALGNTKLNGIYQKTQIEKTKLSAYLKNLIELNIIYREISVSVREKERTNVQRGLYRLKDDFFRFWYSYGFPYLSELESGDVEGIFSHVIEPGLSNYTAPAFEKVCTQYLRRKNQKDALPFHFTRIGRWWTKTDEIDIVATDALHDKILIGECKFKNSLMTCADLENLKRKIDVTDRKKALWYLFSKGGFSSDIIKLQEEGTVNLIGLSELAEEL